MASAGVGVAAFSVFGGCAVCAGASDGGVSGVVSQALKVEMGLESVCATAPELPWSLQAAVVKYSGSLAGSSLAGASGLVCGCGTQSIGISASVGAPPSVSKEACEAAGWCDGAVALPFVPVVAMPAT